jgi:hypothetical protein
MKKKVLLSLIVLVTIVGAFFTVVASEKGKPIRTTDYLSKDIYTDITFLSEGETVWNEAQEGEETGVAYRAIITTSEIYDNLIIEKVTYGAEGGGKEVKSRRKVDLMEFWKTFGLTGEIAGVEFVKWLSPVSFELKVYKESYLVQDIDKESIKVSRK